MQTEADQIKLLAPAECSAGNFHFYKFFDKNMNLIAIFLALVTQSAVDKIVEDRFLGEYSRNAVDLEARLSTMKGIARVFRHNGNSGDNQGTRVRFAVAGPIQKFEYSKPKGKKTPENTITYVYCLSGSNSFHLKRIGEQPYQIQSIGLDPIDQAAFRMVFGKYLNAPWSISGIHLAELIQASDFRLNAARRIDTDRRRIVEVEFTSGLFNEQPNAYRVRLDPELGWAIVESEFRPGSSSVNPETLKIEYSTDSATGQIFPKRIQSSALDGRKSTCEFEKVEFVTTPAIEFQMGYYGLKDVTRYATKESSRLHWWVIASGVVAALFAGSVVLKKAAERLR